MTSGKGRPVPISVRNLDGYSTSPIGWHHVEQQVNSNVPQAPGSGGPERHTAWLTTVGRDGLPHVRPLGVVHVNAAWYFNSSIDTRKTRNLLERAHCVLCLATKPFDLVLEGLAVRVTDPAELAAVAGAYVEQGWPCTVDGDALTADFSAPSGGKPPYLLFQMKPARIYAFGTEEPHGATRFDLPA